MHGTSATITIGVTGAKNYNEYNVVVTITSKEMTTEVTEGVNKSYYSSLAEAVTAANAATSDVTVKLLADVDLGETCITFDNTNKVGSGEDQRAVKITLDMNDHTISGNTQNVIMSNGDIVISGTATIKSNRVIGIYSKGNVTLTAWPAFSENSTDIYLSGGKIVLGDGFAVPATINPRIKVNADGNIPFAITSGYASHCTGGQNNVLNPGKVFYWLDDNFSTLELKDGEAVVINSELDLSISYPVEYSVTPVTIRGEAKSALNGNIITQGSVDIYLTAGENEEFIKTVEVDKNSGSIYCELGVLDAGEYSAKGVYHDESGEFGDAEWTGSCKIKQVTTEITINNASMELIIGEDEDIEAVISPSKAGTLSYSSNDESVVTVDENGKVTAVGAGTATITVSFEGNKNYAAAESKTVTVSVNPRTVTLNEGDGSGGVIEIPGGSSIEVGSLEYSRPLTPPTESNKDVTIDGKAANLYTTCLPTAPTTSTNVKYYILASVSGTTLNFNEVTSPAADTPYLMAVMGSSDVTESVTAQDVTLKKMVTGSSANGFTMMGTQTGLSNADAISAANSGDVTYILQDQDKWSKVVSGTVYIPPFRAFIVGPALSANARELGSSLDDDATVIDSLRLLDADGTEQWYDLSGRRISKPTRKGLYIHNGKVTTTK